MTNICDWEGEPDLLCSHCDEPLWIEDSISMLCMDCASEMLGLEWGEETKRADTTSYQHRKHAYHLQFHRYLLL